MDKKLEHLVADRQALLDVHNRNNFTDGISSLLTDLYPDVAHYLYELLQNAEDMDATTVKFELSENELRFSHNGTKRTFNYDDIDAITNIGHNIQKKYDNTSIGKFGVGFKAVFGYTATPEVHSGEYHFSIHNYFVPNFNDAPKIPTRDEQGVDWTIFVLPFNSQKPSEIAFAETKKGILGFDESTILFLSNINEIQLTIRDLDGSVTDGKVLRFDDDARLDDGNQASDISAHYVKIYTFVGDSIKHTKWLRFQKSLAFTDEHGHHKKLPLSAAFGINENEDTEPRVIPVEGQLHIYFPAEKEHTGLNFHINAPFASTVARDSVRSCPENNWLMSELAEMLRDALLVIRDIGLLDVSFLSVLPNRDDKIHGFYKPILDGIVLAFNTEKLVPVQGGFHAYANQVLNGTQSLGPSLFTRDDLEEQFAMDVHWFESYSGLSCDVQERIQSFIPSVHFMFFEESHLIGELFGAADRVQKTQEFIEKKAHDEQWLMSFYEFFAHTYRSWRLSYKSKHYHSPENDVSFFFRDLGYGPTNALYDVRWMADCQGNLHRLSEIYLSPGRDVTVPPGVAVLPYGINKSNDIKFLFERVFELRPYSEEIEINALLDKHESEKAGIDASYFTDVLRFAAYYRQHPDTEIFRGRRFLLAESDDDTLILLSPTELVFGKIYGNEDGYALIRAYQCINERLGTNSAYCSRFISSRYNAVYTDTELRYFVDFAEKCGVAFHPKITPQFARNHPEFRTKLYQSGRTSEYAQSKDYTIEGIRLILQNPDIGISRLIWNTLRNIPSPHKYTNAVYRPNLSKQTRTTCSSLIYWLQRLPWIPDNAGVFHKPQDLSVEQLRPDFIYDDRNALLKALGLGSKASKIEQAKAKENEVIEGLKRQASELGLSVISQEELEEFEELRRQKKRQRRSNRSEFGQSLETLMAQQSRDEMEDAPSRGTSSPGTKPVERSRVTQLNKIYNEAQKCLLNAWYGGVCQICGTQITGRDGEAHFETVSIIPPKKLSGSQINTIVSGWNSICLCPNCATKYRVCTRDLSEFHKQIRSCTGGEYTDTPVHLSFELDGETQDVKYHQDHFNALLDAADEMDGEADKT